jgi:hypothetical protein
LPVVVLDAVDDVREEMMAIPKVVCYDGPLSSLRGCQQGWWLPMASRPGKNICGAKSCWGL